MRNIMIGVVIGAALFLGGSVFANEVESWIGKTIEGQFPITIDGERIEQPGIVIEGTSYLPVRAAGELFGYEVSFLDSEVILNRNEQGTESDPIEEVRLLDSYENLNDQELLKAYERWTNTLDILPENRDNDAKKIANTQLQEIERIMRDRGIEYDPDDKFSSFTDEQLQESIRYAEERIEFYQNVIEEIKKRDEDRQNNIDSYQNRIDEHRTEIAEKEAELERRKQEQTE